MLTAMTGRFCMQNGARDRVNGTDTTDTLNGSSENCCAACSTANIRKFNEQTNIIYLASRKSFCDKISIERPQCRFALGFISFYTMFFLCVLQHSLDEFLSCALCIQLFLIPWNVALISRCLDAKQLKFVIMVMNNATHHKLSQIFWNYYLKCTQCEPNAARNIAIIFFGVGSAELMNSQRNTSQRRSNSMTKRARNYLNWLEFRRHWWIFTIFHRLKKRAGVRRMDACSLQAKNRNRWLESRKNHTKKLQFDKYDCKCNIENKIRLNYMFVVIISAKYLQQLKKK